MITMGVTMMTIMVDTMTITMMVGTDMTIMITMITEDTTTITMEVNHYWVLKCCISNF